MKNVNTPIITNAESIGADTLLCSTTLHEDCASVLFDFTVELENGVEYLVKYGTDEHGYWCAMRSYSKKQGYEPTGYYCGMLSVHEIGENAAILEVNGVSPEEAKAVALAISIVATASMSEE